MVEEQHLLEKAHGVLVKTLRKDNFLALGEGLTQAINGSTGTAEKKLVLILLKQIKKLCLSLHYNDDESYLHVNKTETYKFKTKDNISFS